eukprot:2826054-Rhodomonas_salina.1
MHSSIRRLGTGLRIADAWYETGPYPRYDLSFKMSRTATKSVLQYGGTFSISPETFEPSGRKLQPQHNYKLLRVGSKRYTRR